MKYAIVFDSKTGNTAQIATVIRNTLKQERCVSFGSKLPQEDVDVVFLGSWCDKGGLSNLMKKEAETLHHQKVALFSTCGFGMDAAYFRTIADHLKEQIPQDNEIVASFVCQGKMPESVKNRYLKMKEQTEHPANIDALIENFDRALSHPDADDLDRLRNLLL